MLSAALLASGDDEAAKPVGPPGRANGAKPAESEAGGDGGSPETDEADEAGAAADGGSDTASFHSHPLRPALQEGKHFELLCAEAWAALRPLRRHPLRRLRQEAPTPARLPEQQWAQSANPLLVKSPANRNADAPTISCGPSSAAEEHAANNSQHNLAMDGTG